MEIPEFEEFFRLMYPKLVRFAQRTVEPQRAEELAGAALQQMWTEGIASPGDEGGERTLQSFAYRMVDALTRQVDRADLPRWGEPMALTDRDLLELVVDGYRVAEISVILDCKPGAVAVRLQRARRHVKLLSRREVKRERQA